MAILKIEGTVKAINTTLLKMSKRAETYDREHLIKSFVDIGSLFSLLSNQDSQILFGRRGTGKTHVLEYLASEIASSGRAVVRIDMRTIGSTGGIYSDPNIRVAERATRLLVDTLAALHDALLTCTLESPEAIDLSVVGGHLDRFADSASSVVVEGKVEKGYSGGSEHELSHSTSISATASMAGLNGSGSLSAAEKITTTTGHSAKVEGVERLRVQFGAIGKILGDIVGCLPKSQIWIILDEWSEVPQDLQPYLADLLRRTVLPIRGITVKIAAIEQRCRFRIPDADVGHIGIEIGADAAASVNLDEFLVFDNNPDRAKSFFRDLIFRHVSALDTAGELGAHFASADEAIGAIFTQRNAFEEFVRASEGVPRDAINIISIAAQHADDEKISIPNIREAARTWYTRAKQNAVSTKENARRLLIWIIDEVIKKKQAKAFLLSSDVKDELIDFLYDARVLHVIKESVSAQDIPGVRYNVYAIDYGCYVELINTSRAPKGLFEAMESDGTECYVEVPRTDFRSIRRAILDINAFYSSETIGVAT